MSRLIVDSAMQAKLKNTEEMVVLCDDAGRTLGHFIPVVDPSRYEGLEPGISEEELQRRERMGGGRALADILADLEKRA